MRTFIRWGVFGVAVCSVLSVALAGGERTNVQGMGMARTFVAGSRGLDAVGINPANLAANVDGTVTLSLLPFGVHIGSDFMTLGLYNEFFTGVATDQGRVGRKLTDADKQQILRAFPGGVGSIVADVEARPLGLTLQFDDWGAFALSVTERVAVEAKIPHDYAEFVLYGNTPGSTYDFSQTSARAIWMREYAFSFGKTLPTPDFLSSLAIGGSVKLVQGFGFYQIDRFHTQLTTGTDGVLNGNFDLAGHASGIDAFFDSHGAGFNPFPTPAGTGLGFDMGIASDVTEYLRLGVSVTDIGSIDWTANVKEMTSSANLRLTDPLSSAQRDSIENAVQGESRTGQAFSTSLPTTFRAGLAIQLNKIPGIKSFFWGEWLLAFDYNQGVVDAPGSVETARYSLGLEFKPWGFLPLRSGISFGGTDRENIALGFGLHFGVVDLDFASENMNFLLDPESLSHGSVAAGLRIRI